jgi:glucose/arabinose dehydrogenase
MATGVLKLNALNNRLIMNSIPTSTRPYFQALTLFLIVCSATSVAGTNPPLDPVQTVIASGFSSPVAVRNAGDGSNRLFVVEQAGRIRIIKDGATLPTPFLDIDPITNGSGERGLLGLAFHPNYASNGFFYVYYTDLNNDTVIARYSVSGNPDVADDTSALKIISIDQDFTNHNGGDIHFSPADGYLYIGLGDGGDGNDPCNRGQTKAPSEINNVGACAADAAFTGNDDSRALLGALLRIDVDSPGVNVSDACGEGTNYGIPADNPFSDANEDCGEIYAWGLRNPYRWSFDRDTGDIFLGDVGQFDREEVDFLAATSPGGENYGWVCREGILPNPNVSCTVADAVDPIIDYDRTVPGGQCSVIGGYRYRGADTSWYGTYLYADFCAGEIYWSVETSPNNWTTIDVLFDSFSNVYTFGEDEQGNLYYASSSAVIRIDDDHIFDDNFD